MRSSVLAVILAVGCGSSGDATPDAAGSTSDSTPVGAKLALVEVLPAVGHSLPIDEQGHYEVRVKNEGDDVTGLLSFAVTGSSDFEIETNGSCGPGFPGPLLPGAECYVMVKLVPSTMGPIDAQVVITADPGGTVTGDVHGVGLEKNVLQLSTDRIDFHGRAVGQTSSPLPVTVTNTGAVTTGALALTIGTGKFSFQSDTCTGQTLAPQGTCTFGVVFAPTTTPTSEETASIKISTTPGGYRYATAVGHGATILMDEWQWLFPDTAVNATSTTKTFTLTNTQGFSIGPLTTNAQNVAAAFQLQDNCNGVTLTPGATCTYVVSFHPTAVGAALGVLLVTAPDVGALRASAGLNLVGYGQ